MNTNKLSALLIVVLGIVLTSCGSNSAPTGTWEYKETTSRTTMMIESDGVVTMDVKFTDTPSLNTHNTTKYREFKNNRLVFENGRVWTYVPQSREFIAPDGVHFIKVE